MIDRTCTGRPGFTLIEMVIAMAIIAVVLLAIGVVTADSQRGWTNTYDHVFSEVNSDGYVAMKKFDAIVRKAASSSIVADNAGQWLEVHYYADEDSESTDSYARFYKDGTVLKVKYGPIASLSIETICKNVSGCTFKSVGQSAQMILSLDDGTHTNTVVASAMAHN